MANIKKQQQLCAGQNLGVENVVERNYAAGGNKKAQTLEKTGTLRKNFLIPTI